VGFGLDVGTGAVLYGASAGVSRVVTNPFYVRSAQDRHILQTANEGLVYDAGLATTALLGGRGTSECLATPTVGRSSK
jgi:hypothetical protein